MFKPVPGTGSKKDRYCKIMYEINLLPGGWSQGDLQVLCWEIREPGPVLEFEDHLKERERSGG